MAWRSTAPYHAEMVAPLHVSVTALLALASGVALWSRPASPGAVVRSSPAAAVDAFVGVLLPAQQELGPRGLELRELTAAQQAAAERTVCAFLGGAGLARFLRAAEQPLAACRLAVRCEPAAGAATLELSSDAAAVRCAFAADGRGRPASLWLRCTRPGAAAVLADEAALARALLLVLEGAQRERARIAATAPAEPPLARMATGLGMQRGVPVRELDAAGQRLAAEMVARCASCWRADAVPAGDLAAATLSWSGGDAPGAAFCLRIQASSFACELLVSPGPTQLAFRCR
jgi:hypothetical protein